MMPEPAKNLPEAFGAAHGWTAPGREPRADCNGSSGLVGAGGVAKPQSEHDRINAREWPGTRQLCSECGDATERCEEDAIYAEDGSGPMCVECWEKHPEYEGGGGAELGERNGAQKSGAVPPIDPKLSDGRGWRGPCMAVGKAAAEARAVTATPVRCSAWLGVRSDLRQPRRVRAKRRVKMEAVQRPAACGGPY